MITLFSVQLRAQTAVYWDTNGATAGSSGGTTAAGTWDQNTTSNWTTDQTGTSATATWQTLSAGNGQATFSAGANATDPYVVTVSGGVTGVAGLTFEEGTVTISGSTLTLGATSEFNTGANNATITSIIGGSGLGVAKTGTGTLTLGGANTFSGGLTIKAGTVVGATNAGAFGAGAITLGDSAGSADASLSGGLAGPFTNAINVVSGSTGTLSITNTISTTFSGAITLANNLTLAPITTRSLTLSGGVTGTGNLIVNSSGSSAAVTFSTNTVNNAGTITNQGTNTGTTTISGGVGSNVTTITENSTTSALTISANALNVNSGGTTLINSAGTKKLTVSAGVTGTGDLILHNDSATASGVTLTTNAVNNVGRIVNAGTGSGTATVTGGVGSNVTGVTENSTTSALTISTGAVTVNSGGTTLTNQNASGSALLTVSGGTTGTGDLVVKNNSAINNGITLSGTSVNHTGTITNSGTGSAAALISAVIGTNVTGVVQDSATSQLTLSGANTFSGGVTIKSGTASGTVAAAFGTGAITLGNTSGSADATLNGGVAGTVTNPINVAAGSSGTLSISNTASVTFSGAITLNNHLTFASGANRSLTLSGGITGTGNLIVNGGGTSSSNTFSVNPVNNVGTITNQGTNTGTTTISGGVGSNVTAITENSSTSAVTISTNALNVNSGGTTLTNAAGTKLFTVSGGTAGTGDLFLRNNSATSNGVTLSTTSVNHSGGITNSGSGSGNTLISAVIGTNVTGVVQNSATSQLNLSGANTFTGDLTIKSGTVSGLTSASALGAGKVTIGDSAGSADAMLNGGLAGTFANPITVAAGSTGTLSIANTANSTFSGPITLNNHLTLASGANRALTLSGGITGAGNIIVNGGGTSSSNTFSVNPVNNVGTITNQGTNTGTTTISGGVGSNVTAITENSTTSALTISTNALNVNSGGTTLTNAAGTKLFTVAGGTAGTGDLVLHNDSATSNGLTLSGTAVNHSGGITNSGTGSGNTLISAAIGANVSGLVQNSATSALTLSGSSSSFTGTISVNLGTLRATTSANALGAGDLTLAGGTLELANNSALNFGRDTTLTANSVITSDRTSAGAGVTHTLGNLSLGAQTLTISVGSNVASGTARIAFADVALSASGATFAPDAGAALTLNDVAGSDTSFTAGGAGDVAITGGIATGAGTVTKNDAGTLTFSGSSANTYTGTTTVNAGTLALAKSGAATAIAGNLVIGDGTGTDTVRLDAANQLASTSGVTFTAGGTPTLNLNGFAQTLGSIASTNSSAVIAFGSPGGATDFTVGDATSTTYAGTFTSGNANGRLVKEGAGALTLSGASPGFTGAVLVDQGTLKVQNVNALGSGTAGTTVASGATLQLDSVLAPFNGTLTLSGTGVSGVGALYGTGGNNRWESNITLAGDATIGTNATGYLALGLTTTRYNRALSDPSGTPTDPTTLSLGANTLTLTGTTSAANHIATYINAQVTGTGNLVIAMTNATDTVRMTNNYNPTFTGTTQINNGILSLATLYNTYPADPAHPNFFAINGPVVIGDGTGAANSAQLTIQANTSILYDEMMNYTTPITLKSDGQFSLLAAQTIGALTFNGGNIDLGTTGSLFLNDDVTVNASAGHTATITGSGTSALSLTIHQGPVPVPNATRTFNLVGGAGNTSDLTIGALIYNGSIVKTGAGTMTITSDNHAGYEGTTTINNGTLAITNNSALGQSDGTDTSATLVNGNGTTNGTLQLSNNITVTNEKLTLNNTGYGNNGALRNLSGNNTWNGEVVVNDARTQSDAGLLTLNNTVTINTALEVTGSGNTTISGPVGGATGTLTKNGTGTLIVSGTNTYGGATTINTGVLSLQSNAGLGAATGGTTVSGSGGALELSNAAHGNLTTSAEPLALNGTGISGNGALRNAAGNNTFAGQVTLQSAALLTANTGTTLTLSGGVTSANQAATFGTTANNGNITISGVTNLGTGSLTKDGSGTLAINGTGTNTTGAAHLNAGTISVGSAATLKTGAFDSAVSTTLIIASGGTVVSNYASGSTTFSGAIDGTGGGIFQKDGAGTLVFDQSFNAGVGSQLILNGGTLSLASAAQITFGKIHITADTVLDFNGTDGTVLSSTDLVIDAGVHITVNNWKSTANQVTQSTVWYATNTVNTASLGPSDHLGNTPLNQITFTNYNGMTTTWVSGNHDGWFNEEIRPTPEPATYGLCLMSAAAGLLLWQRQRRRQPDVARHVA
ncbi:autotransporter-associated beta strand repeat-containing protein [Horticoccus luteus]|uniref:Autotransporter-associated beta strand repeat-containing protein n=1 Tax=Horticoccus luteus TaxID=2862869 RepID=A0A8F9TX56_9BACT|nr:autotransporter-associated beta strand repeat-containing protein [Horticoccus luteus]QYM79172.1 autotransporter-associated beta strand repeat-containing protein [Horticoccus luteus]